MVALVFRQDLQLQPQLPSRQHQQHQPHLLQHLLQNQQEEAVMLLVFHVHLEQMQIAAMDVVEESLSIEFVCRYYIILHKLKNTCSLNRLLCEPFSSISFNLLSQYAF
jgi:hypothetical protein